MNRCLGSWLLLLSLPVQAGFVLRDGFSEVLSQQFSNLTQLKNQTSSLSKELVTQNAMRGLWFLIGPHLEALPGCCKKPFSSNCSVFFDAEIDQVVCDAQFEEVQAISTSCEAEQRFPVGYLAQLHKSNILQTRIVVGLAPVQHPQAMYWLYDKLPPTLSQSVTQSNSISGHSAQTDTDSASPMNSTTGSVSPSSLTESLLSSRSVSFSPTVTPSLAPSHSVGTESLSHSQTLSSTQYPSFSTSLSPSSPVVWNPEWANWDVATGAYRDATNQTGRYNESIPGIVTDSRTGLQWQKATASGVCDWTNATQYCESLMLGGHADWRLPTVIELQTLVDYTIHCIGPTIDSTAFPDTPNTLFWASDAYPNNSSLHYYVSFGSHDGQCGGLACTQGTAPCSVPYVSLFAYSRCVRPARANQAIDRYFDENGEILTNSSLQVQDKVTNLVWQRFVAGAYNWSDAISYCNNLNLGKYVWRLPTIKELSTLFDISIPWSNPTINTTSFPDTPATVFWSSTLNMDATTAWYVVFWASVVDFRQGIQAPHSVRCVRSPVVVNPDWANWDQSLGVYKDATNQTARYIEAVAEVLTDTLNGLQWQKTVSGATYNWTAAADYCGNLFQSGFGDWRLPTRIELQNLVDYTVGCTGPGLNTSIFPETPPSYFWTSTSSAGDLGYQWYVSFGGDATYVGFAWRTDIADKGYLRCVRPLSTIQPLIRYTDEVGNPLATGSVQVKDVKTGLIWQRAFSGVYNWLTAEAYCKALGLGGQAWRLPSVKESSTLLNTAIPQPGPTIDTVAFPDTPQYGFWSSTSYSCDSTYRWGLDFADGSIGFVHNINDSFYCRCVRDATIPDPEWANWDQSMGVYEDATNQTGRFVDQVPGVVVGDTATGLQWQKQTPQNTYNWTAAQIYCEELILGGYADWRLPTHIELQSILDYAISGSGSAIDQTAFPNSANNYYWSSVSVPGHPSQAWYVSFGQEAYYSGLICSQAFVGACDAVNSQGYVRCVRPLARVSLVDRYRDESGYPLVPGSTQVQDLVTGLTWQRGVSLSSNWSEAVAYCQNLTLDQSIANPYAWRLPTIKELATLIDVSIASPGPTLNATVFSYTGLGQFWSSTVAAVDSMSAWRTGFDIGRVGLQGIGATDGIARCVRTPVIYNPDWANWDVTTGVYEDQTNQTNRYAVTEPNIVADGMTGLKWQQYASQQTMNWTQAQAYCDDLVLSGYANWRLPTHVELQMLVDYTLDCAGPSLNQGFFSDTDTTSYYWSSDPLIGYPGYAWWVGFGTGGIYGGLVCSQGYSGCARPFVTGFARCVRPLSAMSLNDRYVVSSTQVIDVMTSLIWQRIVSGTYYWSEIGLPGSAQAYCSSLNLDGFVWRLPTVKELSTLLDVSIALPGPTINTTAFPGTQSVFWTSSSYSCRSSNAWNINFNSGYIVSGGVLITDSYYARCVRSSDVVMNPDWANWNASIGVYQDATNQTGRYVEGRPGVMKDTFTGLQWEQQSDIGEVTWADASAHCSNLFKSGYGDWRLPTLIELQSLVDYTLDWRGPTLDASTFPNTPSSYFWTSTPVSSQFGNGWWYVSFGNNDSLSSQFGGLICSQGFGGGCANVPMLGYVRCVRPGSAKNTVDRYRDQAGDGLTPESTQVRDLVTGLIWQRAVTGLYNWSAAQFYCFNLTLDGFSWRVPTLKELSTLLDERGVNPGSTINQTAFPSTPQDAFWPSTWASSFSNPWYVDFNAGAVTAWVLANSPLRVRCVRGP
ncbi:MAG: DUF1566 domain-containing protein [Myxococcaceae bacterium]|nr:DUF1566 domain-containing protein [Myxococcaceae bacterium]MBH2006879.1 DUF1566 domain-containing protein [Myxococcaceae bacterium]